MRISRTLLTKFKSFKILKRPQLRARKLTTPKQQPARALNPLPVRTPKKLPVRVLNRLPVKAPKILRVTATKITLTVTNTSHTTEWITATKKTQKPGNRRHKLPWWVKNRRRTFWRMPKNRLMAPRKPLKRRVSSCKKLRRITWSSLGSLSRMQTKP